MSNPIKAIQNDEGTWDVFLNGMPTNFVGLTQEQYELMFSMGTEASK